MKKYILTIDTSATSPENKLYVYESDTIKGAKEKLAELNLVFAPDFIYCALIGKKEPGRNNNRYFDILRTDDGIKWSRDEGQHVYNPTDWSRIGNWEQIDYYQAKTDPACEDADTVDEQQPAPAADDGFLFYVEWVDGAKTLKEAQKMVHETLHA